MFQCAIYTENDINYGTESRLIVEPSKSEMYVKTYIEQCKGADQKMEDTMAAKINICCNLCMLLLIALEFQTTYDYTYMYF